jgi:hypothetical protein
LAKLPVETARPVRAACVTKAAEGIWASPCSSFRRPSKRW